MPANKRRWIPRKLMVVPAAVISALVFLLMTLLGLLQFNPPSLSDESSVDSESRVELAESQSDAATTELVATESITPTEATNSAESKPLLPLERVDVLIDGDDYWLGLGQSDTGVVREIRSLGEVVGAIESSENDASGIRVRVTRTFQATAQAERALIAALSDAGLDDDQVDRRRTLVERPDTANP